MTRIDEEKLVTKVLTSVIGIDSHGLHGHIELSSSLAQDAIENIVFGLIRDDSRILEKGSKDLVRAFRNSIETWESECEIND